MAKENLNHPITRESFAIIDREVGQHSLSSLEYRVVRRVIHATADFEFLHLVSFSQDAIAQAIEALRQKRPIITDVTMVKQGIITLVQKTFDNPIITAIEQVDRAEKGKTRTETGMIRCLEQYPQAIYVIGNAPTALLAICQDVINKSLQPTLIIGAPVGFVSVLESKEQLEKVSVPQIRVNGRKGGSAVASAILNELLILAWEGLG
ncbi:MAG: cobalt-precorrin-8X methylmutase [Microcystaceae cyanobacterium]